MIHFLAHNSYGATRIVMSVAQLQAHIAQLSADIVRQKEVLKNLESRKKAAEHQLNMLRDPVARLPVEISSEIFIQCLPSRPTPDAQDAPLVLLNICKAWTDIALSTPALWAAICADEPMSDLESLLDAWLERAGSRALTISLPPVVTYEMAELIGSCAHRVQDLTLNHEHQGIVLLARKGPFPCLTSLTMADLDQGSHSSATTRLMLRACPNLVTCTLQDVFYEADDRFYVDAAETLVLPHIRHFKFGTDSHTTGDSLLRRISLPGLRTLFILLEELEVASVVQFLRRSSPPLQELIMGDTLRAIIRWTLDKIQECLSLLPTLTHFELRQPQVHDAANHLLTILANSRLPQNLSTVTFRLFHPPPLPWLQKLYDALLPRRNPALAVRLIWEFDRPDAPKETALAQLRQLVADGMKIHVGTEMKNYI
ncbi:hypothetical protein FB451DRAFT_315587 [Mycena latifolia]|nr:hypothetical protein FB451DRAFT_315587 [Mycena latifolia]